MWTRPVQICAVATVLALMTACTAVPGDVTPDLARDAVVTRVAFGSCADQNRPQPIWRAVIDSNPDLFILTGDNVYGDVTGPELAELRAAYQTMSRIGEFKALRRQVPLRVIWDDHDFGTNDGGGDFPYKAQSKELFLDVWNIADDDPRRHREGLYHEEIIGPSGKRLQIILLDTRFFRSPLKRGPTKQPPGKVGYLPDDDPSKTMLGAAQWQWLETALRRPAEVRLLVSSIQVLAQGHRFEKWDNLPKERQRLFEVISRSRAEGVVLVSGDRHFSAFYKLEQGLSFPLYEVTSSSLNLPLEQKARSPAHRISPAYAVANFGLLDIDWQARKLTLELRGIDNRTLESLSIDLEELRKAH